MHIALTQYVKLIAPVLLFYKVLQTKLIHFDKPEYFIPNIKVYKQFLVQGIPSSLNMLTMAIGSLILTYFVSHYGMYAVAGFGIGYRVEQLMLLPALGLSTAVLALVSNNFGAKKYDRVQETFKTALKYGFIISTVGIVILTILMVFLLILKHIRERKLFLFPILWFKMAMPF